MAVCPQTGELMIIEMNPRVSRSSALASKATGFPIAKFAAKLSVGYTLDQIANDITQKTPACFEPSIDYIITKIPRFAFEKFPGAKPELSTMMKSVGACLHLLPYIKQHEVLSSSVWLTCVCRAGQDMQLACCLWCDGVLGGVTGGFQSQL